MGKPLILAYVMDRGLDLVTAEDVRKLTHINLAFGVLKDGLLDMSRLTKIDCIKKFKEWNPALKIVLSVGGWGAGGFSNMAMTEEGRRAFAASVGKVMDDLGLDGVDIDWEYPCNDSAEIDADPRDRENFTALMAALRDVAGDRIVSIAAGGGDYFVRDTEMDKVAEICDYIQLMTYDLRSGFCKQAGHHTGLFHNNDDVDRLDTKSVVDMFHAAGVPKEKIIIGAAFYSRKWSGVPDINNGMLQQAETVGGGGPRYDELSRDFINKNGWVRHWDDDAKAPYLFNGSEFISYDDPISIALKCEYLKQEGLMGIMYWEHTCDSTRTLLDAMYELLRS